MTGVVPSGSLLTPETPTPFGADFAAVEFDGLRGGSWARAYSVFSLHLAPDALDTLSAVLDGPLLCESLAAEVEAFDDGGGGANLVSP